MVQHIGRRLTLKQTPNNTFIIDNVQGQFSASITTLSYIAGTGTTTVTGAGVTINTISPDSYYDGLHMKILHTNHGMHSSENYVRISSFRPIQSEINSTLSQSITAAQTVIPVTSSIGFETFEGVTVSTSNPGYAIIGNEVI